MQPKSGWIVRGGSILLVSVGLQTLVAIVTALLPFDRTDGAFANRLSIFEVSREGVEFSGTLYSRKVLWKRCAGRYWISSASGAKDNKGIVNSPSFVPATWGALAREEVLVGKETRSRAYDARGWPFLAFECELERIGSTIRAVDAVLIDSSLTPLEEVRALPFRPLWRGITANVACYAPLAAILLAIPGFVRRSWWCRHGCCPHCGYEWNRAQCSECGYSEGE